MTLLLAEGVADATLEYFRDSQTAKLSAIDSAGWAVNIGNLSTLRQLRYSDPNREHEPQFPVLYMIPIDASIDTTKGHSRLSSIMTWAFWIVAMGNGIPDSGLTPAEHARRLAGRYVIAVLGMLLDMSQDKTGTYYVGGQRLHWLSGGVQPRIEYGLNMTGMNGEYLADARLIVGLELQEQP